jgi:hypothetical protein
MVDLLKVRLTTTLQYLDTWYNPAHGHQHHRMFVLIVRVHHFQSFDDDGLLVCDLFNDAVSSADYIPSDD